MLSPPMLAVPFGLEFMVRRTFTPRNHPPASLTKEVEALSSACRSLGCQLQPKVLYLDAKDEVRRSQMETERPGTDSEP